MNKPIFIIAFIFFSVTYSQVVNVPFIIYDNGTSQGRDTLRFGLDPTATDGIDAALGEFQLPPPPPSGIFDCRFVGEDISIPQMGQGMDRDYRQGTNIFVGNKLHELKFQRGSTATTITISWNMPAGITGKLTDLVGGVIVNDTMAGSGSINITNGAINKLFMRIYYSLAPTPPPAPGLITPSNGAICVPITPALDWTDALSATSYGVQVATDPAFSNIIINVNNLPASQYSVPSGLAHGTLYYWRANASNAGGAGSWSGIWNFTAATVSLPGPPVLLTPVNGSTGISLTPMLDWSDLSGAASYKIEVSASNVFTTITDSATVSVSQYNIPAGKLSAGTAYYWRVFGKNICNTSPASAVWNFTTSVNPPPAPTLILPLNASSCISLTAQLDWSDATGAASYGVQVSTSPTFATYVINVSNLPISQYSVSSGLSNNTLYYWRANASNTGGAGSWSAVWSFTTVTVSLPSPVTLLTPLNGAIGQSLTPTLDWSDQTGAASYKVELSTNNLFTTITDSATIAVSQYTVPSGRLSTGSVYYWRVFGKNTCNISPASQVWNFTTAVNPPIAPTLVSPPNAAVCQSLTLTLDWSDVTGAASYTVQVSFVPSFATMVINESNLTSSQYTVPSNLVNNTQYYWRVNAVNPGGTSSWSSVWSFTTTTASLTANPLLSSPANGATGQSLTPVLIWFKLSNASSYRVQISTSNLFTIITDSATVTDSFYTVPAGKLANHVVYYWRVFGTNTCNISPPSLIWNFQTDYIGLLQNSNDIPKEYKLYDNYPNPFNPSTSILFDIPQRTFVTLKIWDLLGKEVFTLIHDELNPGRYEYTLNAFGLSSGIYLYKLEANNFVGIKKMVLLK